MITTETLKAGPTAGTGAQVNFTFAFKVYADTDIDVILTQDDGTEVLQTLTTHYTVALNGDQDASPGGTVTMVTAPTASEKLTIIPDLSYLQPTKFKSGGPWPPEIIEQRLDYITGLIKQHAELFGRALLGAASDDPGLLQLPTAATRATKYLYFDASGAATVVSGPPDVDVSLEAEIVGSLPPLPDVNYPPGYLVYLTTDGKLYVAQSNDTWATKVFAFSDITGQIADAQVPSSAVVQHEGAITLGNVSGSIPDAKVPASAVTQHQAALTLTEAQISDLGTYAELPDVGTQTFLGLIRLNNGQVQDDNSVYREIGFRDAPANVLAISSTIQDYHMGSAIFYEGQVGSVNLTIPNAGGIAAGEMTMVVNNDADNVVLTEDTTVNLIWLNGAGATGNRTLAGFNVAFLWKRSATDWFVWGNGLS